MIHQAGPSSGCKPTQLTASLGLEATELEKPGRESPPKQYSPAAADISQHLRAVSQSGSSRAIRGLGEPAGLARNLSQTGSAHRASRIEACGLNQQA
jgi:hypothetical protein